MHNFIECYPQALTKEQCDGIISKFRTDTHLHSPGCVAGGKIDKLIKQSTDITNRFTDNNRSFYNNIIYPALCDGIKQYATKYDYMLDLPEWCIEIDYNIQVYKQGEGFGKLHCEKQLLLPDRILAWMFYLNDAKSGTTFPMQDITLAPKTGDLWIWPAYWTHAHRGVVPNQGFKCIATGWCVFKCNTNWRKAIQEILDSELSDNDFQ